MIKTTTVGLKHLIRLRHASTGEPVTPVRARLVEITPDGAVDHLPHGWSVRVRGGDVIVVARDGVKAPAVPLKVRVTVADPVVAMRLHEPTVDLDLAVGSHSFQPADMAVVIDLVNQDGAPRTGRTLLARATSGPNPKPTVPLPEEAPGVYRSVPTRWTAALQPFDLMVNAVLLRKVAVDFTRKETRVRLVDTT